MQTILKAIGVCIVLAALKSEASGAAITLATDAPVGVGQTTIVDLLISDVGDAMAPSLGAYDITITFDASLLGFASAAFGDPVLGNQLDLTGLGSLHGDDPGLGNVNLFEVSLDPPDLLNSTQAGAFVLARLTLIGLSEGTSSLGVLVNTAGNAEGGSLTAVSTDGSLDVVAAPVPELATLIYFSQLPLQHWRCGDSVVIGTLAGRLSVLIYSESKKANNARRI